ncbi:MAG: DNA-3-methyladenine glycosylase [Nocardioidaceae bacterium]
MSEAVLAAARSLLGARLSHGEVVVRITEVEAYDGANDPASHAYRGETPRNAVMFGPPDHLYVYFTYGMHWCANVVCGADGDPSAVLLRAGAVESGLDLTRARRGGIRDRDLARGPARLCQALGITGEHNGVDLRGASALVLTPSALPPDRISSGPRVGVSTAADRPWRFWVTDEPTVSVYRPARARTR